MRQGGGVGLLCFRTWMRRHTRVELASQKLFSLLTTYCLLLTTYYVGRGWWVLCPLGCTRGSNALGMYHLCCFFGIV